MPARPLRRWSSRTHVAPEIVTLTLSLKDMVADLNENRFPVSLIANLSQRRTKRRCTTGLMKPSTPQRENRGSGRRSISASEERVRPELRHHETCLADQSREGESLQSICAQDKIDVAAA